MRSFAAGALIVLGLASHASAQTSEPGPGMAAMTPASTARRPTWRFGDVKPGPAAPAVSFMSPRVRLDEDAAQPLHAAAVTHSDAYRRRATIHKDASFATLPLFGAELALGQSLYTSPSAGGRRTAHAIVGAGIAGLFAVNTVTGAWNLFGEGRRDRDGRTIRLVHGLLMMVADVGILATTLTGPNSRSPRQALTFAARESTHRNLAIATISVGTAGYLLMIFKGR